VRFATVTIIEFSGHAPRGFVTTMEEALGKNKHLGAFQVEPPTPGRVCISADVLCVDFLEAGGLANAAVKAGMVAVGWDRPTRVMETSVVPVLEGMVGFRRPRTLRQLGYGQPAAA